MMELIVMRLFKLHFLVITLIFLLDLLCLPGPS